MRTTWLLIALAALLALLALSGFSRTCSRRSSAP